MVGGRQLTFIRMTNYRESNKRSKERQTTTLDVHFRDVTVTRGLIKVSFFHFRNSKTGMNENFLQPPAFVLRWSAKNLILLTTFLFFCFALTGYCSGGLSEMLPLQIVMVLVVLDGDVD